jgi:hypothetical protein
MFKSSRKSSAARSYSASEENGDCAAEPEKYRVRLAESASRLSRETVERNGEAVEKLL